MATNTIPWSEFKRMNLTGRDIEIKFETLVERGKIKEFIPFNSEVMFCPEPDGASSHASNFTKRSDTAWRKARMSPTHSVLCLEENTPKLQEDGTIHIRTQGPWLIVIHKDGDNLELPA